MGLFSGKDVYTFESVTAKLTDQYPHPMRDAILTSTYQNQSLPAHIQVALLTGFNRKIARYRNYAIRSYPRGLPDGTRIFKDIPTSLIRNAIINTSEPGKNIILDSYVVSRNSLEYFGYQFMQDTYNWNHHDNVITLDGHDWNISSIGNNSYQKKVPCGYDPDDLTKECTQTIAATHMVIYLKRTDIPDLVDDPNGGLHFPDIGQIGQEFYKQIFTSLPSTEYAIFAKYHYASQDKTWPRYWAYTVNDARHPAQPKLDRYLDLDNIPSDFYPVVPIRVDRHFINENDKYKDKHHYAETRTLLKKINLDVEDLIDAVHYETDKDDNPDKGNPVEGLDDINDVYLIFALDLYTEEEESAKYFYLFFDRIRKNALINKIAFEAGGRENHLIAGAESKAQNYYYIEEHDLSAAVMYNYISVNQVSGGILDDITDADLRKEYKGRKYIKIVKYKSATIEWDNPGYHDDDSNYTKPSGTKTVTQNSYILLRYQNRYADEYTEIKVHGLSHIAYVEGYGRTRAVYKYIDPDYIKPDKNDSEHRIGSSAFFIPISRTTLRQLSTFEESHVLLDGMMLTINAANKTHLEWYQTGLWAAIFKIVALAIMVWGIVSGQVWASIMAATWIEILIFVAILIFLPYLTEFLIEELGVLGIILAVIISITAAYFNPIQGIQGLPFAQQLMTATSVIIKVLNQYVAVGMEVLEQEFDDFLKSTEEADEELQKAQDLLNQDDYRLNPLYITGQIAVLPPEETASQFLSRTGHIGNPGVLTLDAIQNYHSDALRLPEPDYNTMALMA